MQEEHLRSKKLERIVQTRNVTAKIDTRNFENHKKYCSTYWLIRLSLHLPFFHRIRTLRNKKLERQFFWR